MTSWQTSTALILGLMVVTYAIVGAVIGYVFTFWFSDDGWLYGMALFLLIALVLAIYCYTVPVDTVLKGFNATKVSYGSETRLYEIVAGLADKAGTPMPEVYVCDLPFPNAFALGRSPDRALVAATRPLMDMLTDDELEGVMAHELSHIIHRDTIVNMTARNGAKFLSASALVMGGIGALGLAMMGSGGKKSSGGGGIFFLILIVILIPVVIACLIMALALPVAGAVMRFGVSRSREYGADESAGRITGRPMALANALLKMDRMCSSDGNQYKDYSSSSLWIVNPLGRFRKRALSGLMDTHPSTESRVERLRKLDAELNGPR